MKLKTLLAAGAAMHLLAGCYERQEKIEVLENGDVSLQLTLEGTEADFDGRFALPSEPEWALVSEEIDTTNENVELKREYWRRVTRGQSLPETFAATTRRFAEREFRFPTELRMWREGDRRFYEFRRVYRGRTFKRYNGEDLPEENEGVEQRVIDRGIMNVSQEDRDVYLEFLQYQFVFRLAHDFQDALGLMLRRGELTTARKREAEAGTIDSLMESLTSERILDLLQLGDDELTRAYDEMIEGFQQAAAERVTRLTGVDQHAADSPLQRAFRELDHDRAVTERLDRQTLHTELILPGEIVATNGITSAESPGEVSWEFDGKRLHDADIPLYALSVLDPE